MPLDQQSRRDLGRAANRKGKDTEQAVARYMRENGWPQAQRRVRAGWNNHGRRHADQGDLDGIHPLTNQTKASSTRLTNTGIREALAETADQAVHSGSDLGFLIERRDGKANPADWWFWIYLGDLHYLIVRDRDTMITEPNLSLTPVRLLFGDAIPILHRAGYGNPT